jgi:hypothetical protein
MPITLTSTSPAGPANATIIATADKGASGHVQFVTLGDGSVEAVRINDAVAPALTTLPALMIGAIRKDTGTALAGTDGDISVLQVNSSGSLRVDVTTPTLAVSTIGTSIVPGTSATHLGKAEDAVHASGDTGVFALAVRTDTPTQRAGSDSDYSPFATNSSGALWVSKIVDPAQGVTPYTLVSAATNNATSVKASAGVVTHIYAYNRSSSEKYVKLYNKASAPSPASDSSLLVHNIPVPPSGGVVVPLEPGLRFSTGIAFAIVGSYETSDNTSVAAGDVILNLSYK